MMKQPTGAPYPIADFLQWRGAEQLVLVPKFQRRDVWSLKAKSYLIDTILRAMPIPPLYLRLSIDPSTNHIIREVVDGQQRLRTIFDYVSNKFAVMKVHNKEYADCFYGDLPPATQSQFLTYKFLVYTLENVSDQEILGLFARLNTYTEKLNQQELFNAEFFGDFKQTVYGLAHLHYNFWKTCKILSDKNIARMGDAKLVSELLVSMVNGIGQTKSRDLRNFYEKFDDQFLGGEKLAHQFSEVIGALGVIKERISSSSFRRIPLFFSLFLAMYDCRFGLPNSHAPRIKFNASHLYTIGDRLAELSKRMADPDAPKWVVEFAEAAKRATADPSKRRLRHRVIIERVLS